MAGDSDFLIHGLFLHAHTHLQLKDEFVEKQSVFLKGRTIKPAVCKQTATPGREQNLPSIIQQGNNIFQEGTAQSSAKRNETEE